MKEFGEPGIILSDSTEALFNPCVEVGLAGYDRKENSGFQMCNLTEINMKAITTPEQFYKACEAAAILGTLQAGYTDFDYLGNVTENIVKREALLGVSMTGIMDNPQIALNPHVLRKGAKIVLKTNKIVAKIIGINPAARTTCVKPAGSTSCILETASGIHPHHARKYFRRVQVSKKEDSLKLFKDLNPLAVSESIWSTMKKDDVITFCCEIKGHALTKQDMPDLKLLDAVKLVQQNWVIPGKDPELCVYPWLNHNVSNTIQVHPGNWNSVQDYIFNNKEYFAGISFLGSSGDLDYGQAPFQQVLSASEIIHKYGKGAIFISGLIVHALNTFDNNLFNACQYLQQDEKVSSPKHTIHEEKKEINKKMWVKQVKQFAERYFDGDVKELSYCMKHVDALKQWTDILREYKSVPWDDLCHDEKLPQRPKTVPVACSGGSCEIVRI